MGRQDMDIGFHRWAFRGTLERVLDYTIEEQKSRSRTFMDSHRLLLQWTWIYEWILLLASTFDAFIPLASVFHSRDFFGCTFFISFTTGRAKPANARPWGGEQKRQHKKKTDTSVKNCRFINKTEQMEKKRRKSKKKKDSRARNIHSATAE